MQTPALLPTAATGAASPPEPEHMGVSPGGTVKILLVDDENRNLEVLDSILAAPGHQLILARNPEAALLAVVQDEFACIVLDVQMPGMNGIELAHLIKTRKRSRHIPIIFLTAYYQDEKEILQAYGAGAVDFLTKPLDPQILKSKVGVFVDLFRTSRALAATNSALELEVRERQKAEEALRQANAELGKVNLSLRGQIREREQLEALVLTISEREQQRIGQDLHDGLCQYLTGVKFKSTLLEQKLVKLNLREAADARTIEVLLSQAIEQARHQARGLDPIRLESDGLVTAMQELAASVAAVFGVECTFVTEDNVPVLDHARAIHFYRITQEAVSNAIKHGKANKISLRLVRQADNVVLTVEDNGTGFAEGTKKPRGAGLHIMNYRARTIGAALHIKRNENGGTVVTCSLSHEQLSIPNQG